MCLIRVKAWTPGSRHASAHGLQGETMSDNALKQDILDELEFEPSVDATTIGVAVHDG